MKKIMRGHLRTTLEVLKENNVYAKRSKYDFYMREVLFSLSHHLKEGSISRSRQYRSIIEWMQPKKITEVRSF